MMAKHRRRISDDFFCEEGLATQQDLIIPQDHLDKHRQKQDAHVLQVANQQR